MPILIQLAVGLILSALIGVLAYRRGSLSRSGVVGAIMVGTAIFGFGGLAWGLVLIVFFVTSSALSHYKESAKADLAEKFEKGHRRDLGQTLANGGAGALIAIAYAFRPAPSLLAAFVGVMATVNADTWATELGVLNKSKPRLITTWTEVEIGTSGGVSAGGTLAAIGGALLIGVVATGLLLSGTLIVMEGKSVSWGVNLPFLNVTGVGSVVPMIVATSIGGLLGSLFDSLLGATVQAIYYCPACYKETERSLHTCGTPTELRRGWRWLNNDMVNFVSSLIGAAIAVGLWSAIGSW